MPDSNNVANVIANTLIEKTCQSGRGSWHRFEVEGINDRINDRIIDQYVDLFYS